VTARRHGILQVYASDKSGRDLVLLGSVQTVFRNGKDLESPFACRILVDQSSHEAGEPRLSLMQVFAVCRTLAASMKPWMVLIHLVLI
jgi:hypothetical protein